MARLGFARRVPLAVSGAMRRFAQDPARARVALERAMPALPYPVGGRPAASAVQRFDRAVARDRYDDARRALADIPADDPRRASCEIAFAALSGRLREAARSRSTDARGRRAGRHARRQLDLLEESLPDLPVSRVRPPARSAALSVLHVVTNSLPVTQAGSTVRTQRVVRAQRDLGWDARVVTRPGYPVTHGDLAGNDPEVIDGVPYHRLLPWVMPSEERLRATYASMLGDVVDRLAPDLLHAASDHVNAAVALEVGRQRGLPVAYEARTFFEDTWLARHGGGDARDSDAYMLLRERHTEVLLAADAVTTLGSGMRDAIIERGVDPERVFVAPNGVPVSFLEPRDQARSRTRLGIDDAMWFGSVATVNDDEGLDTLIESLALMRAEGIDARALIVGNGPGLEWLRSRAAVLDVPLLAPGRVPLDQVRDWFDALDAFALPRRDTDVNRVVTALKPIEAQARGVPVVGSDLPAVAEVLAPGSALVPPGDAAALAEALGALADPARRHEAGQSARAWVESTRTWPSVMGAYRDAYSYLGALRGDVGPGDGATT